MQHEPTRLLTVAALAGLLGLGGPASASVLYSEGTGGDLPGLGPAITSLGTLALGANAITGSVTSALLPPKGSGMPDRVDLASVLLPAGLRLVSVGITISTTAGLGDFFPATAGRLLVQVLNAEAAGNLGYLPWGTVVDLPLPDVAVGASFADGDTLSVDTAVAGDGPGALYLLAGGIRAFNPERDYVYDYTISLVTAPTPAPEPATLALFGASLLGLAATRRRRA